MPDIYTLLLCDEELGKLTINTDQDIWKFEVFEDKHEKLPFVIRHGFNGSGYDSNNVKQWVLARAPEPNYEWIDLLLERLQLDEYDPYEFFKYNRGRFNTDRYHTRVESSE